MSDKPVDSRADVNMCQRPLVKNLSRRPQILMEIMPLSEASTRGAIRQNREGISEANAKRWSYVELLILQPVGDEHPQSSEALEENRWMKSGDVALLLAKGSNCDSP